MKKIKKNIKKLSHKIDNIAMSVNVIEDDIREIVRPRKRRWYSENIEKKIATISLAILSISSLIYTLKYLFN